MPLPHDDPAIAYAPVTHLSHWLRTGQLTSVRLTEIYLERIASYFAPPVLLHHGILRTWRGRRRRRWMQS